MRQEADIGVTTMAMHASQGTRPGDEKLLVKFFNHPRQDKKASKAEGRPIFKEVPYIEIMVPGNKDSLVRRPASQLDIDRFPEHYRKFQAREQDSETYEGTPLEHWPGVTRSQVAELKYMNVHTVEQLADVADVHAQGMMGISLLRERAKAYLEASDREAAGEEILALRKQNEELANTLEAVNQRLAALESEEGDKAASAGSDDAPRRRRRKAADTSEAA